MATLVRTPTLSRRRSPLERVMATRLGRLLARIGIAPQPESGGGLLDLADALLSVRGRAAGPAIASAFFDLYEASDVDTRREFLSRVHDEHPRDAAAIDRAIAGWVAARDDGAAQTLRAAAELPSRRLIRQLNLALHGTQRLVAMREDLLAMPERSSGVKALDAEFEDAFSGWFNAGFLELRPIGWDSPARLLERIIRYEAVHSIDGWGDLRRRLEPADRRCYAFFHPQMADDPLIFVEVALTNELPGSIGAIIAEDRASVDPHRASHAIFYSISNCQEGLRGIPFGNFLIKRVVGRLHRELSQLTTFATLSPVPGFARWLARQGAPEQPAPLGDALRRKAASYLLDARGAAGQPLDPVARFHLGNGARLEAIHADADLSANGRRQSHGIMVNYVYDLAEIEANHLALSEFGTVAASKVVQALADAQPGEAARRRSRAA